MGSFGRKERLDSVMGLKWGYVDCVWDTVILVSMNKFLNRL
jgi:hypothetical protein